MTGTIKLDGGGRCILESENLRGDLLSYARRQQTSPLVLGTSEQREWSGSGRI